MLILSLTRDQFYGKSLYNFCDNMLNFKRSVMESDIFLRSHKLFIRVELRHSISIINDLLSIAFNNKVGDSRSTNFIWDI